MMKKRRSVKLSLISLLLMNSVMAVESLQISKKIEALDGRPYFQSHSDWLGVPLSFAPVDQLRIELEKKIGKSLLHHEEAHITVITSPEWRVLSQYLKMDAIEAQVVKMKLMSSKITVKCIKKVSTNMNGKSDESWYISLDAPELKKFRNDIWRRFIAAGGLPEDFDWQRWSPHITVGYTNRELHDEDKVTKGKTACLYDLNTI